MSCPAHPSISHRPAQRLACFRPWRVLSERVPRDSQTSALSGSVRSTSDFACTVPARNTCLAPVAAHHDMTAYLCVSLFIGSICIRSNLSGSMETQGGAPSSAAAIMRPSKSSKQVPVNPRNGMRFLSILETETRHCLQKRPVRSAWPTALLNCTRTPACSPAARRQARTSGLN